MSSSSSAIDTLYDDIYGEMEDYELALFECDGMEMAESLTRTRFQDDGQSLPGIWCLLGIEIQLAGAGVASTSESLGFLRQWSEQNSFRLSASRSKRFKERIREIAQLRIAEDCTADEINAAAEAMIGRVDQAVKASASSPDYQPASISTPEPPPASPPPALVTPSSDPAAIPPWWPELLLRTQDLCEECVDLDRIREKLAGRVPPEDLEGFSSPFGYWHREDYFPVVEPALVDWLIEVMDRTPKDCSTLLECIADPKRLDAHTIPEKRSDSSLVHPSSFVKEAHRVMLAAAHRLPPTGLRELLPGNGRPGLGIFGAAYSPTATYYEGRGLINLLLSGWAGVYRHNRRDYQRTDASPRPVELWQEIQDLSLFNGVELSRGAAVVEDLLVIHAWCAWCAGAWDETTTQRLFLPRLLREFGWRPFEPAAYFCADKRFTDFVAVIHQPISAAINQLTEKADLTALREMFSSYEGEVSIETMLCVAENIGPDEAPFDYRGPLRDNILPKGEARDRALRRLKCVPQGTLRNIAPHCGLSLPLVLEAIDDPEFRTLMSTLRGTFCEPLILDPGKAPPEPSGGTVYYPGRTLSGVTNLNPLYEAIAGSSLELWQEVVRISKPSWEVKCSKEFLLQMAGKPGDKSASYYHFTEAPAIVWLTRRIPSQPETWSVEQGARLDLLASHLGRYRKRDEILLWGIGYTRYAAQLYAEASGLDSWQEAALEMAEYLKSAEPLESGGYTITQSPREQEGLVIYKGKRRLVRVPPAITKNPDLRRFLDHCQLMHLLTLALEQSAVDELVESDALPDQAMVNRIKQTFGLNLMTSLTTSPTKLLPKREVESLRCVLNTALERIANGQSSGWKFPKAMIRTKIVMEKIQEQGWPVVYNAKASWWEMDREFDRYGLSLKFTPKRNLKAKASGLPPDPVAIELVRLDLKQDTTLKPGDPRIERIVLRLAYEIAMAAS